MLANHNHQKPIPKRTHAKIRKKKKKGEKLRKVLENLPVTKFGPMILKLLSIVGRRESEVRIFRPLIRTRFSLSPSTN